MTEKKTTEQTTKEPAQPARREYAPPKLTTYGNVRDFTRGGTGSIGEIGGTFFKK